MKSFIFSETTYEYLKEVKVTHEKLINQLQVRQILNKYSISTFRYLLKRKYQWEIETDESTVCLFETAFFRYFITQAI